MEERIRDGRFVIRGELDGGVLFDVFEADDTARGDVVRLSIVGATWEEAKTLLRHVEQEARRAEPLIHPHICVIRDLALDGDLLYVAQAAPPEALDERLQRRGRLPASEAAGIMLHVCEALAYAHEQGVVHGALTTHSIRLDGDEVRLDAFPVLGAIGRAEATTGLARRQRAAFISPEEARGNVPGPSSDIYAVGVILFHLLTGRLPFESDDPVALARAHCYTAPPRARDLVRDVPEAIDSIVSRALAKDPDRRPASMKSLLGQLREQVQRLEARDTVRSETALRRELVSSGKPARPREQAAEPNVLSRAELAKALVVAVGRSAVAGLLIVASAAGVVSLLFLWLIWTRLPEVTVPDVTRAARAEAMKRLGELGLTMVVAEERYSVDGPADTVVKMIAPYAGKRVRRGRQVRVIVSKGAENIRVPDVRHQTVAEATAELERMGLKPAARTEEREDYSAPEGHVIDQTPEVGAVVPQGTEVVLVRSAGPPKPRRVRPDTVSYYRVRLTVPAGDTAQQIRIEVQDQDGTVTIAHDQQHLRGHVAEALVEGVGVFTIRIYVDDTLWREIRPVRE
ncbi:MAG: PASTA domain-containing protein [Armatimonadota bacterium]